MQKVLRRTKLAQNQSRRKARILQAKYLKRDQALFRRSSTQYNREQIDAVKDERLRRREAWDLGPLAPWHEGSGLIQDGPGKGVNPDWGTFSQYQSQLPKRPKMERLREHELPIRVGDRVCVVEGRDGVRGKISTIKSINFETHGVFLDGVNDIDIRVSPEGIGAESEHEQVRTQTAPIPYSSVRLVFPLDVSAEGDGRPSRAQDAILSDLVIRHAKPWEYLPEEEEREALEHERQGALFAFLENRPRPRIDRKLGPLYRYVMPQSIRIPWPTPLKADYKDQRVDTRRTQAEERTFLPTLLRPPMPESVIDELRNRYSVFRVRHEDDYIAEKTAEDERAEAEKRLAEDMKNQGGRNIARHANFSKRIASAEGNDGDDPTLALLGSHMAARRAQKNGTVSSSTSPAPSQPSNSA